MVSMLVIVPTRGRPENAERLLNAFIETHTEDSTELLFAVDDDDPLLGVYLDLKLKGANVVVGPRLRMAGTLNMSAIENAGLYDVIGFMGDDHVPRTDRWDVTVKGFARRPGAIVYGNDLIQGAALPTAVFMDSRIIRKLGYMVPPGFVHLFLDNTWLAWGSHAETLRYLPGIVIEHMHPLVGKAEYDEGYTDANSNAIWAADEKRFIEYRDNGELVTDVGKIRSIGAGA